MSKENEVPEELKREAKKIKEQTEAEERGLSNDEILIISDIAEQQQQEDEEAEEEEKEEKPEENSIDPKEIMEE